MLKPEYIMENYLLFGWNAAEKILYNQLRRLGKSPRMAQIMAIELMCTTIRYNTLQYATIR